MLWFCDTYSNIHCRCICFSPTSVYKEYRLKVSDSANLPACVLVQWLSSLPRACIVAHGYPRLCCPRVTSHPHWMIFQRCCCCCQELQPGQWKMQMFVPLWIFFAGVIQMMMHIWTFWQYSNSVLREVLRIFIKFATFSDLFCSFGKMSIMAFEVKWQIITPLWLNIIITCCAAATVFFFFILMECSGVRYCPILHVPAVAFMEMDVKEALHCLYTWSSDYLPGSVLLSLWKQLYNVYMGISEA